LGTARELGIAAPRFPRQSFMGAMMPRWDMDWNKVRYACCFAMGCGFECMFPATNHNPLTSGWFVFVIGLIGVLISSYYVQRGEKENDVS